MVAGDVVNGVNVSTSFIPAAGVSICITWIGGQGGNVNVGISDGVTIQLNEFSSGTGGTKFPPIKAFITNTIYLERAAVGDNFGFAGIQIA